MASPRFVEFFLTAGVYKNQSNSYLLILQIDAGMNTVSSADPGLLKVLDASGNIINVISAVAASNGATTTVNTMGIVQLAKSILIPPGWSVSNINLGSMKFGYGLEADALEDLRGYMG